MSGDHAHLSLVEVGQNTEKSPGNSEKIAVTQIPVQIISFANVKNSRNDKNNPLGMCKNFKSDHTNRWYLHNSESPLDIHTLLWYFEIERDILISVRRQHLVIINQQFGTLLSILAFLKKAVVLIIT